MTDEKLEVLVLGKEEYCNQIKTFEKSKGYKVNWSYELSHFRAEELLKQNNYHLFVADPKLEFNPALNICLEKDIPFSVLELPEGSWKYIGLETLLRTVIWNNHWKSRKIMKGGQK